MGKNTDVNHVNTEMDKSVADRTKVPQPEEVINKLKIDMQMAYIDADTFVADPYALLGQVIQIRKKDGKCPVSLNDPGFPAELTPYPVPHKVKESSKLKKPELRNSIMVDSKLAASVSFLNYLSAELTANSVFSLMVFDQASGLIDMTDPDWRTGLEKWKKDNADLFSDPDICYLFAIAGFIQKNIVRKRYVRYDGSAKGGAFGVNIDGKLSTGTDEFSLDIKFGLVPIVLRRPVAAPAHTLRGMRPAKKDLKTNGSLKPTAAEYRLFSAISGKLPVAKKKKKPVAKKIVKKKAGVRG